MLKGGGRIGGSMRKWLEKKREERIGRSGRIVIGITTERNEKGN